MEPKPTLKDIKELLANIRASTRAEAAVDAKSKLVKKFENVSLITTIKNPLGCKAFLDAYIVSLVKQYLHDECAQEILFVAYGLLEDFTIATEKEIDKRRIEYASRAINNTYIVSKEWKAPHKSLYKKEEKFITAISTEIEYSIKNKGNDDWHLNLGGGVARKLVEDFSDGIPEQYPLPKPKFIPNYVPHHAELVSTKPRSFSHTVTTKEQDTQDEPDDSTEAISGYGQEETSAGVKNLESSQSVKSETFSEEPQSDATERPPQPLPQDTDKGDFTSEKGNENVIKGNIDSHNMNIQINNYYTYPPLEVSPDSGVMERDPPSIEYSDPEPELTSQYYLVEKDSSIGERVGQFFVKVKNWYCKQSKKAKMTKKAKTTLIIAGAAIPAIILVITFFNMNVPTSPSRTNSTGFQRSSLLDTSSNDSEFLENQLIVTSEDMPEIINEARSSIEVLDESGEYDVESIKDLIFYRIVYNPVYGDMVVRGFREADSFMQDKIGEGHPQLADFISESSAALGENEPDTFIPDMSHWLIKISSQVSTTDNYKEYARFLCAMLENSFSEIRVDNFDSTSHWSIGGDAEGISAHAELVERSSNQPAIIFENIGDDNQLRYQVAFFLKDGSFATCNPWVKAQRSTENLGQERPSYTIEEVENGALGDKIVFNSISDGVFGDEKNFVDARPMDNPDGYEGNDITVENGKEYIVRLYVHNNNPKGEEAIAEDVRVAFALPELNTYAKDHQINGFITSSNATPNEYWDSINFHSDTAFKLTYVPGSARINNNGFANADADEATKTLSDDIIKSEDNEDGVLLGYEQAGDGKIPGCFEYDQVIYIRVKAEYPDYWLQQQVRLAGDKIWKYNVEANVGDRVEFQIEYRNIDDEGRTQENVMIRDILPMNMRYIDGTIMLYNSTYPEGIIADGNQLFEQGVNIGSYGVKANAYIRFTAEVVDNSLEDGSNALVNWAKGTANENALSDYAVVMVNKE